jgi:hypothetical protein
MKNKAILFSLMLVASSSVLAEQSLIEGVAKQAVEDKATEVAPGAVKGVEATNQTLGKAKSLKGVAEIAPDALQDQAKEVVKEKASAAVPAEVNKAEETVKSGKESAEHLKGKVEVAPKSTKALKSKAKHKAIEKALELPQ